MQAFAFDLFAAGLSGIALLALIEKLVPIIPSYVLYVFLGMNAIAAPADLPGVVLSCTLGSTVGGLAWFGVGYALGERRTAKLVERFGPYLLLTPQRYARLRDAYRRNALTTTLLGHVVPVVRFYLPLPAGMLALKPLTFLLASALGCLIWNAALLGIGFGLRQSPWPPLQIGVATVIGLLLLEISGVVLWRWRARRSSTSPSSRLPMDAAFGEQRGVEQTT